MKYFTTCLFILFAIIAITAQEDCPTASSFFVADWNFIEARFNHSRADFTNEENGSAAFEYPAGSDIHAVYASGFVISGMTPDGQVKVSSQLYGNDTDFAPGPLSVGDVATSAQSCEAYDRFWLISKEEIFAHLEYFECVNNPDCDVDLEFPDGYVIPNDFLDWPAHGDPNLAQAEFLAPFYDSDNNNTYDPEQGDCPLHADIMDVPCDQGLKGDISLFWIENDRGVFDDGSTIGIEVHNMVYTFLDEEGTFSAYGRSLFHERTLYNRGINTLMNTRVGAFVDPDLGNSGDDYVGCDVDENIGYVYNGDSFDENTSVPGYENQPAAVGVKLIRGPYRDEDGFDNDGNGVVDDETLRMGSFMSINGDAISSNAAIYNTMHSMLANGQPLLYNNTDIEALYMYPGESDSENIGTNFMDVDGWYEGDNGEGPGDRKFMISSESFTLAPLGVQKFTFVYIARGFDDTPFQTVGELMEYSEDLGEDFEECPPSVSVGMESYSSLEEGLWVYPNPTSAQVNLEGVEPGDLISLYSLTGQLISTERTKTHQHVMDLRELSEGLYLVQVEGEVGVRSVRVLVE